MPRFVKLKLKELPKSEKEYDIRWTLVIDNKSDLDKYHEIDAHANMEMFLNIERDDDGDIKLSHTAAAPTRGIAIQRMLQAKIMSTPEGETIYPIIEVANYTDKKYLSMLKYITEHGAIQINSTGGYCGLQSFINTWDAEVLEDIEKDSFGLPVEDAVFDADTVILENSHKDYTSIEDSAKRHIKNPGVVRAIYNLMEVDKSYILKCLSHCNNVFIRSELQNDKQVNEFSEMFCLVSKKNIYLQLSEEGQLKIKSLKIFKTLSVKHNIIFVK